MGDFKAGDRAKFIEHVAVITDFDSLDSFAECASFREGCQDVESKVEKVVERLHGWMFAGNGIETEYCCPSGRTSICEAKEVNGKIRWYTVEELTPRTVDLDELSKVN